MTQELQALRKQLGIDAPSFLAEDTARQARWAHLTEGLKDTDRIVLENLLDNAQRWALTETTTTQDVATFTTYGFPLIRRVYPNLIAQELVSVQPMTQPTALIFYLDFLYGTARHGSSAGDRTDLRHNPKYAGGMVRGEIIKKSGEAGSEDAYTLDYTPVENSEIVYVDGVVLAGGYTIDGDEITFSTAPATEATVTIDYQLSPAEGEDNVAEMKLSMTSDSVVAETKKLKAQWTLEAQQDLMAYHGLNAENELLTVMGNEIIREIDRLIINHLLRVASAGNVNWSSSMPVDEDGNSTYAGSQREYEQTLFHAILDANNLIYRKRFQNANWIVADPDTCTLLEKLDGYKELNEEWVGGAGQGVERFGVLRNRFTVYKDPGMKPNTMLLGYKGNTFFETGYVYAPYIPLYTTPIMLDPNDFTPRRGVMTRFARKPVITDYYATVTITQV